MEMLKNLKSKKLAFFGRQISVTVLALLALTSLASAGLLSYYGMVTGTATVTQSVLFDGNDWTTEQASSYTVIGRKIVVDGGHWLTNNADILSTVKFETTYSPSDEEIETTYHMASPNVVTSVADRLVVLLLCPIR